jgi:proteasome lid subunit RPN8/RPN11
MQLEEVERHAEEAYPRECCGCLLGTREGDRWLVQRVVRTRNLLESSREDRYQMDPADRFRAEELARKSGEAVVGFYHSHPDHEVYFSQTDLQSSEEFLLGEPWLPPTYAYLVMSVIEGKRRQQGAFVVKDGKSHPLELRIE